jgi:hypothetical protein
MRVRRIFGFLCFSSPLGEAARLDERSEFNRSGEGLCGIDGAEPLTNSA